jgi:hypothetical protein
MQSHVALDQEGLGFITFSPTYEGSPKDHMHSSTRSVYRYFKRLIKWVRYTPEPLCHRVFMSLLRHRMKR